MKQKCDICGASGDLVYLRESYKTSDIDEVCGECERLIDKQLNRLRFDLVSTLLKAWMRNLKNRILRG